MAELNEELEELKCSEECEGDDNNSVLCIPQERFTHVRVRENYSHDVVRGTSMSDTNVVSGGLLMTNNWDGEGRAVKEKDCSSDVNAFQESLAYDAQSCHKVMSDR